MYKNEFIETIPTSYPLVYQKLISKMPDFNFRDLYDLLDFNFIYCQCGVWFNSWWWKIEQNDSFKQGSGYKIRSMAEIEMFKEALTILEAMYQDLTELEK